MSDMTEVLIVRGGPGTGEPLQTLVEDDGRTVRTATSLSEAEAILSRHDCDVVVADVGSPGPDGLSLLEGLRQVDEAVPLIVITHGSETSASNPPHAGVYEWIVEPVGAEKLARAVERAAERKRLLDETQRLRAENEVYREKLSNELSERSTDPGKSDQELNTLARIGHEISATLDLNQLLKRVTEVTADICGAHRCSIVLISNDGKVWMPAMSSFSDGQEDEELWHLFKNESYPVPVDQVPEAQQVVREQRPLFIPDAAASSLPPELIEPFGIRSVLLVPLISKEWVIGLMALDHVEENHRFTARQTEMATSIAGQATLAIEKAMLYRQARRQARHGALLSAVAQQVNAILKPELLLPAVAETIHEHFSYDSVILMRRDPRNGDLVVEGKAGVGAEILPDGYRQPADLGIVGWVARRGERLVSNDAQGDERYFAPFPDGYQAGSEMALPLTIEGEVVGVLDLQCRESGSFDELDIETAWTLAQQIATALQNARLYEEAQRRAIQLGAAVEVARDATAILDVDELLSETVDRICGQFGFHYAGVFLREEEGENAVLRAASAGSDEALPARAQKLAMEAGDTKHVPVVRVARTGEPQIVSDVRAVADAAHPLLLRDTRSEIALPLVSRGAVIGVLDVQSTEEAAFSEDDSTILQAMADQLTNALENARLYAAAQQRVAELEAVRQAGLHVTSSLELQPVLEAILESALELVRGADAHIFLYDGETLSFGAAMWDGKVQQEPLAEPRPYGVTYTVARRGEKLVISDGRTHPMFQDEVYDGWDGAIAALPLKIGEQVQGVMNIAFDAPHTFSEDELNVLSLLADQAAIAVENARLYREEQRHVEELTALHNIDLAITSTLSLDEVLQRVYEQVSRLMDVTTFYIGLYDKRKDELHISLVVDEGERLDPITLDLQEKGGFAGWVARTKEPLWIEDWEREQETLPVEGIARGTPTRSLIVAPLLARGELVGVISTQSYEPYAFDADHRRLFSSIASQVAIAVENARLFGEVNRRLKEMRLLQKLILAASSTLDFDEVLTRTIKTLKETLHIERLAFALPDEDGSSLIVHPSTLGFPEGRDGPWALPMDETTMGRAYLSGEALLFTDVTDVPSSLRGARVTRTELAVPVRDGDEVVAVLNAESRVLEDFDQDDLSLFSAAAAQLGVMLKNARLFEQTRRRLTETRLLQQVMQAGAASLDFDQVLERTVETLHRTLGIEHLSFALPVEDGTALRLHPSQIGYAPEMTEADIPLEGSLAGRAYLTGEAQVIGDVRERPDYFEGAPDILSELNVPVRVAGRVVAVLNVESRRKNAFDEEDVRLFEAVAAQLGIVLENARLYETLQRQRDELSQAYEELKEIDRLRTELVQNVSHELRTPFTLVQGYLELLMAGDLGPVSEEQREALLIVRNRVGALQRRTRDLTTLSSLSRQEAQSKPTCILKALRSAVADLTPRAQKAGVRIAKELPEALSPVIANEEHLVQAFAHLIENAIKFSPDGGTVTIRAWSEDGQSFIAVDDEGIGIGPKHLNHVFKRFYQVDGGINRRFGGMGVGLAVVWEIVEMYGGSVDVRSSPQEGSTFTVALPQARSENVKQIPSAA